jgi:hypothetical protein
MVAVVISAAFLVRRDHVYSQALNVPMGAKKQEVLGRLGKPYSVGKCGQLFGQQRPGNCEELIYPHAIAPINPQYVALMFVGDRLVDRYVYSSP